MQIEPIRRYEDLDRPAPDVPASRMFHEASGLGPVRLRAFRERIEAYSRVVIGSGAGGAGAPADRFATRPKVSLPAVPRRWWGKSLARVLRARRTRRAFGGRPLTIRQVGTLLGMACGVTGHLPAPGAGSGEASGASKASGELQASGPALRAWPSAGALYPIEAYALALRVEGLSPAAYAYDPHAHRVAEVAPLPAAERLRRAVYADGLWERASLLVVLTAVFARTQAKYGERGYRFALIEAGHVAQNLCLVAEDLGLAVTLLGGFDESDVAAMLGVPAADESPVYAMLVGTRGAKS